MRRVLALKKENLAELTARELGAVNGAAATAICLPERVPTDHCASAHYTCLLSRHMDPCVTYPCV